MGLLSRLFKGREQTDQDKVPTQAVASGTSGTAVFSGLFDEEYLTKLQGKDGAELYDKMRRSESQIKMALSAVKSPIKAAKWEVDAGELENTEEADKHKAFVEKQLMRNPKKKWDLLLNEYLSIIHQGFVLFERSHIPVMDDPEFGPHVRVHLGWRDPKTIEEWTIDPKTEELISVRQCADGDLEVDVEMPGQFLTHMALEMEGANYEGISMLRAAYGPWLRLQFFQKVNAVGIEVSALSRPIATAPKGMNVKDKQFTDMEASLQLMNAHEKAYLIMPHGWMLEFEGNKYDPEKVIAVMAREDRNIVKAFLANFLELGASSATGSHALSFDQSDFFLGGIEHIAKMIAESLNVVICEMIDLNFGPQESYPTLGFSGIRDKAGVELADMYNKFITAGVIIPDEDLETHIRKRIDAPKADPDTARKKAEPKPPEGGDDNGNKGDSSDSSSGDDNRDSSDSDSGGDGGDSGDDEEAVDPAELAERKRAHVFKLASTRPTRNLIRNERKVLKEEMQKRLRIMGKGLADRVMAKMKTLPSSQIDRAIIDVDVPGVAKYRTFLSEFLEDTSVAALTEAEKEVPATVELLVREASIKLADKGSLSNKTKRRNRSKANLLSDTQRADLSKIVFFQFTSTIESSEDPVVVEAALSAAIDKFTESASVVSAAGTTISDTVNSTRNDLFLSEELLEEIESMTFFNLDPVALICKNLAGKTFDAKDPRTREFITPLHFNCDSIWSPNFKGGRGNPSLSPGGLTISGSPSEIAAAQKSINL